jgi:hypothetical protein
LRGVTKNDIIYPIDRERILSMKRIASIFIALSLCTLPCFADTETNNVTTTTTPTNNNQPALHSDCTNKITNATRAIYTKKDKDIVCTLKKCKCGYKIEKDQCVPWGENPPKCKITNAELITIKCDKNNKEVCTVTKCKDGYKEDNNKCIKETKAFTTAQEKLKKLKSELDKALKTIKSSQT